MISKILYINLWLMLVNPALAGLSEYTNHVIEQCPKVSRLLIKKSLLEIGKTGDCSERFSSEILKTCPHMQCMHFVDAYKFKFLNRPGLIVGE